MRFWVENSEISPLPSPLKATLLLTGHFCSAHSFLLLASDSFSLHSCFLLQACARLFLFPSLRFSLSFSTLPRLICILFLSYIILLSRAFPLWENRYYFRSSSRSLLPLSSTKFSHSPTVKMHLIYRVAVISEHSNAVPIPKFARILICTLCLTKSFVFDMLKIAGTTHMHIGRPK